MAAASRGPSRAEALAPVLSVSGHAAVIALALLGGWRSAPPPVPSAIDVSLVSAADLASRAATAPSPGEAPPQIAAPEPAPASASAPAGETPPPRPAPPEA